VSIVPDFLAANEEYAENFDKGHLPKQPGLKVAIVACMDARIDPAKVLGLEEGDAHVIRNAGGRAADALRSLAVSQRMLGTREVIVIHHTDCGMRALTNEQIRAIIADELGPEAAAVAEDMDFHPLPDAEHSVLEDIEIIRNSPLIPHDIPVHGFVYDVFTGQLTHIE
jgi:carbonic anhydrase